MKRNKRVWVYDIETISNFFSYVGICSKDEDEKRVFLIWEEENDFEALINHLENETRGQIGFNSLHFDYPVLHNMMVNKNKYMKYDGEELARAIYKVAQDTIKKEWPQIKKPYIPQLDLFRIHHFDNRARMVGFFQGSTKTNLIDWDTLRALYTPRSSNDYDIVKEIKIG